MIQTASIRLGTTVISIEKLLEWAFSVELVTLEPEQERGTIQSGLGYASLQNSFLQMAMLGTRIDTSAAGATYLAGQSAGHWDAETVAAVLSGIAERRVAEMVAAYARAGARPTWMPNATPRCVPAEVDGAGHAKMVDALPTMFSFGVWRTWMEEARRSKRAARRFDLTTHEASDEMRNCIGRCTPVVMQPSHQQIARARETYLAWWMALHDLRDALMESGMLKSHSLSRELPPAMPWEGDGTNPLVETGPRPDWRK